MKKIRITAILLAVLTVAALLPLTVSALTMKITEAKGVDLLEGKTAFLSTYIQENQAITKLNDGVVYGNISEGVYLNEPVCNSEDAQNIAANPGKFTFNLTDGSTKSYYYTIEYKGLDIDCDSFAIYCHYGDFYLLDYQVDILVSRDGGKTYTLAWASVPFVQDERLSVVSAYALPDSRGGNMNNTESNLYEYVYAYFTEAFKNVTNVVYGCAQLSRLKSGKIDNEPQYNKVNSKTGYTSEFQVFNSEKTLTMNPIMKIDIDEDECFIGNVITVNISVDETAFAGLYLSLDVPDGFEPYGTNDFSAPGFNCESNNNILLFDSPVNNNVSGRIVSCRYLVTEASQTGEFCIGLTILGCVNQQIETVPLTVQSDTVTIKKRLPGDANGNGALDILDIVRLQKYIAGVDVQINTSNADVNENGDVDILDLVRLKKMLAGNA